MIYDIERIKDLNPDNLNILIEAIRYLSEFLIFSEKYNKNYFEYVKSSLTYHKCSLFIEVNVMDNFIFMLKQRNRNVNIQLIQTMSILLQNINDQMKICKYHCFILIEYSLHVWASIPELAYLLQL